MVNSLSSTTALLRPDVNECPAEATCTWPTMPGNVVKSAGRALQILEYFDDIKGPANMAEVSRALEYPESSTSVLLRSLATLGYLSYDRYRRTYHPTNRVRLLGNWVDTKLFESDAIIRLMERVNRECADTVILASRNGLYSQYIHVVQALTALRLHLTTGTLRPIVASATGYVILKDSNDIEIGQLVRRVNSEAEESEKNVKVSDVIGHINSIRNQGYFFSESTITPGTSVIAMPVPQELTQSSMAIAIGGPTNRMMSRKQDLIALLSDCINCELDAKP